MKKQRIAFLLAIWLLATVGMAALGEGSVDELLLSAVVIPRQEYAIQAPASGTLAPFSLRAGDGLAAGDTLFTIQEKRVYAQVDGTVAAVYVAAGDSADAAQERYGGAVVLERADRYEIHCNTATGHNSEINRTLYVGTPVCLRSVDKKRFADGLITSVEGRSFTVAVIGGNLQYTKDVRVYRDDTYEAETLLAKSTLSLVPPVQANASGTVLSVAVQQGDQVKAGDLLFTYAPDVLSPDLRGRTDALTLRAEEAMVVSEVLVSQGASVQKDQALCTAYAAGDFQLRCQVEEKELSRLRVGDTLRITFEDLGLDSLEGAVASIAAKGSEEDTSKYFVYVAFDAPEGVLAGMHATLEK